MAGEINNEVYDFGLRIKSLRKSRRWTQEELGRKIGVKKDAISAYENNTKSPPLDRLKKIATVFNVSVDYLLGLENASSINISNLSEKEAQVLREFITKFINKE